METPTDRAATGRPALPARYGPLALAVLRVGIGVLWIQNAGWKVPPAFGEGDPPRTLYKYTRFAVDHEVFPPYAWLVENLVLPNFQLFGWAVLFVEAGLGAFLLVGLFTRLWALVGIAQSLAITLSVLDAPHEWHWAYFMMILAHIVLLGTVAGRYYGADALRRPAHRPPPRSAAIAIGTASVFSIVFLATSGDPWRFVPMTPATAVIAAVLGLLAIGAGVLDRALPTALVGSAFCVAAILVLVQLAAGTSFIGGNASTLSWWLGLGVGLLAVSYAARAARRHPKGT